MFENQSFTLNYSGGGQLLGVPEVQAVYYYDHRNLRLRKNVAGTITDYTFGLNGSILSESGSGGADYVWLGNHVVGVVSADVDAEPRGYVVVTDHVGTPKRAIAVSTSEAVWAADHEGFGYAHVCHPGVRGVPRLSIDLRYPGQLYDAETDLHYNWNRYYDSRTGRYLTPDPLDWGVWILLCIVMRREIPSRLLTLPD